MKEISAARVSRLPTNSSKNRKASCYLVLLSRSFLAVFSFFFASYYAVLTSPIFRWRYRQRSSHHLSRTYQLFCLRRLLISGSKKTQAVRDYTFYSFSSCHCSCAWFDLSASCYAVLTSSTFRCGGAWTTPRTSRMLWICPCVWFSLPQDSAMQDCNWFMVSRPASQAAWPLGVPRFVQKSILVSIACHDTVISPVKLFCRATTTCLLRCVFHLLRRKYSAPQISVAG